MSISKIINDCKKGNLNARKDIYNHFSKKAMGICLRYCSSRQEAEDYLKVSFFNIFKNINFYESDIAPELWLKKIVINTVVKEIKKKNGNKLLLLETNYKRNEFTFESSSLYNNNIQIEFLKRLPDGKRVIFNLHAIEGYSHPEIATLLEIQESTSILQLAKAKEMLQEMHLNYHNTVIIRA